MRIRLEDIDPQIAEAVRERASGRVRVDEERLSDEERQAYRLVRQRRQERPDWAALGYLTVALLMGFILAHRSLPFFPWFFLAFVPAYVAWLLADLFLSKIGIAESSEVSPEELRVLLPQAAKNRFERVYCETLVLLLGQETLLDGRTQADLLDPLKSLMENYRVLERQRRELTAAMGADLVVDLVQERETLARQWEAASDAIVRDALRQSLEMCDARLQNARSFALSLQRIEAQQEVVYQALSSVHAAVARMRVAPQALVTTDLDQIRETVAQVDHQSRAVEQAVQEVMALRARG